MGRKPTGEAVLVRLAPDMLARIAAIAPNYGRAAFIRDAVAQALERREGAALQPAKPDPGPVSGD